MSLVILCYHTVGDWDHPMAVPVERLRLQLELMVERGYRGTTFTEAVLKPRSGKWLAVTFDDGFRAVHDAALPVLDELGLVATLFLPTAYVGQEQLTWPDFEPGPARRHDLLPIQARQVRALASAGWEIGSHSRTHPRLTRLADDALRDEVGGSREECESAAGAPCRALAYPFGDVDARVVEQAARAGYQAGAALTHRRAASTSLEVARVAVYRGDGDLRFRAKVWSPMRSASWGLLLQGARSFRQSRRRPFGQALGQLMSSRSRP